MKTTCFKIVLFFSFLWIGISLQAQVPQTICEREEKTYTVDDDPTATPAITPSPSGSYAWTLTDESSADLSSFITDNGENSVTIDWTNATFDGYTLPATFTLTVIETVDGCSGEEQILTITLIQGYEPPVIAASDPICNLDEDDNGEQDNEVFNLTGGTPGAIVSYNITSNINGTVVNSNVTLDSSGNETIPVPALADPTVGETFTLTLTQIDGASEDDCEALTIDPAITQSVTVNPTPTTTPIGHD